MFAEIPFATPHDPALGVCKRGRSLYEPVIASEVLQVAGKSWHIVSSSDLQDMSRSNRVDARGVLHGSFNAHEFVLPHRSYRGAACKPVATHSQILIISMPENHRLKMWKLSRALQPACCTIDDNDCMPLTHIGVPKTQRSFVPSQSICFIVQPLRCIAGWLHFDWLTIVCCSSHRRRKQDHDACVIDPQAWVLLCTQCTDHI